MFKVGQTVWCLLKGKGTVTHVEEEGIYPVLVNFGTGVDESYSKDGRLFLPYNRSLFFSEPKVEAEKLPPFAPSYEGKFVLVRRKKNHNFWCVGFVMEGDETEDSIEVQQSPYKSEIFKKSNIDVTILKPEDVISINI